MIYLGKLTSWYVESRPQSCHVLSQLRFEPLEVRNGKPERKSTIIFVSDFQHFILRNPIPFSKQQSFAKPSFTVCMFQKMK